MTSRIRHDIYFWSFLKIKYCFVCSIFVKRVTYFKRRKCLDFLTDFHIEERGKNKLNEIPQALAKDRSVTVEIFLHICDNLYENWTYDGMRKI